MLASALSNKIWQLTLQDKRMRTDQKNLPSLTFLPVSKACSN